jgi:putative ABC transport system substrate-binding protein
MKRRDLLILLGGVVIAWPDAARAQQQPMPVIGWLSSGSPASDSIPGRLPAFWRGLNESGYAEGQNVAIEYRWAEGQYDRFPALAADLVHRRVAVIVTPGPSQAFAAKAATSTIPIVFETGIDPVQSGLVASLNHPGGNITGVSLLNAELAGKRLDLLHELLPTAAVVALLVNPANPSNTELETTSLQDAARALGLQVHVLRASTQSEIDAAFGALADLRAAALVVAGDAFFTSYRDEIVALAARHAVPAIYIYREFAEAGGLMSYGTDLADSYRQVGIYTGKILKGANPGELPVQQVVKLELVINLKSAKTLGLTIPLSLLGRADEVIE